MTLQRAESTASSGAASSFHEVALKSGILNQDPEQDDLLQTSSLEAGVFGVLFTLHEKDNQRVQYHWIILKYFVTAWQVFTTIVTPEFGWDIDPKGTLWKCISVLSFRWFKDVGFHWYMAALFSFAGLLAVNLVLCVWVAWSFKEQKFDYVWPIKVVRYFAYVFLQVFDMTSLSFLQLGISCNYSAHGQMHLQMDLFPQYSCKRPPHVANAIVSGLLLVVFVVIALLFNMAEVEVNPASQLPQALGHSGAEMTAFGIKALMTLVGVFLGWPKVASIAYMLLAAWLVWEYLRWVPNLLLWVNCLKSGVAGAMLSVAVIQVLLVFLPPSTAHQLTVAMGVCLGPAFALGAVATWLRIKVFTATVTRRFRTADPEAIKPQDVYHFAHPRDVEVAARCARVWTDLYTLEKTAVHRAEEIIKAGVALFPDSAFVALVYANFMLDMLGFSQTGAKQLESVRKFSPGLMCRFMLFVRHQQATQKAASSTVGKGGNMDLLGYVEYQRKQRTVLRHHKDALQAMTNFWRILGSSSVSFTSLSKSLENIDNSVKKAESAYRVAMELYNNSPRLVRLYARFLETIKQDPWSASQYYASAERLEENKDYNGQGPSLPDGTPMSRIDEVEKGILVVNAFGDIQVANRKLHDMFGYEKGDLDGKNVTALMPPHEAKRHPAILRRYIDSGDKAPPYFRHPVLGIHRERVALTVHLAVSRASGLGEDSVFIGILELLPIKPGLGRLWVTPEGVIVCCDPGFVTCFGYHPDDVIGMHLDKLLRSSAGGSSLSGEGASSEPATADIWATNQANNNKHELVQRMLATATDGADCDQPLGNKTTQCRVLHNYDFAKSCSIEVRRDMTDAAILEVHINLVTDEPQLLMVVERKGAIRHMSGDLAKVLGVRAGGGSGDGDFSNNVANGDHQVMLELMVEAPPCVLDDFLPSPWKAMHYKYRKYVKGGCPMLSGAWGCRAAVDDSSSFVGPTMRLIGMHGKPVYVHVAVSSREAEGEPMHVVRMARSSLETAIAERRLRMRVSLNGVVQELEQTGKPPVYADPGGLFGFPVDELLGCSFGDFLSLPARASSGAGGKQPPEVAPADLDFLAEAEAAVATIAVQGSGGVGGGTPPAADTTSWEPLDSTTFDEMVTNALQTPGISWRVNIVSPRVAEDAAALGNPARTAAVLSKRTKQAVLKLDVVVPPPSSRGTPPGKLVVHAELWVAEAVTGVFEIDGVGRISGVIEEDIRPPGLLFGLPQEDIVGAQLGSLLRFLPGQSPAGLLTDSGIAKKSALKATSRKGKVAVKVGPVHQLDGFHRDHQPLSLAVQVVGKPGPGNRVIAVVRFSSQTAKRSPQAAAADTAAGPRASGGQLTAAKGTHAHVCLAVNDLRGQSLSSRGGPSFTSRAAGAAGGGGGGGGGTALRLRQASMGRSVDLVTTASLSDLRAVASSAAMAAAGSRVELLEQAAGPPPPPQAAPLSLEMPQVAAPGAGGDAGAAAALPGASSLAAGVAGLMRAKGLSSDAGAAAAAGKGEGSAGGGSSSPEKPQSPSPAGPSRVYSRRPPAAVSRKALTVGTAAAGPAILDASALPGVPSSSTEEDQGLVSTSSEAKGEVKDGRDCKSGTGAGGGSDGGGANNGGTKGGGSGGQRNAADSMLETLSLAAGEAGSEEGADVTGLGGVNKWVATGGKFYRNRAESVDGMSRIDGDLDDDDDGNESFGGFSRATSSHFASPRGSLYGGAAEGSDEKPTHPHPNGGYPPPQHQYQQHPYPQNQYGSGPHPYCNPQNQYHQYGNQHPHQHLQGGLHQYGGQHPYQQYGNLHPHGGPHPHCHQHNQQYQQYGNQHPHAHQQGGGGPHSYSYQQNSYQQYGNQHPHHRQGPPGGMMPGAPGVTGGGFGAGFGGGSGGGSGEWEGKPGLAAGPSRLARVRRSSFLQSSGSLVMDAARALDALSIDQGDDHDSDGESDVSGISDSASDDSGTEDPADYKRGRRYRKLIKLMNSPQVKKAMVQLKILTILAVLAAVSIHVLSFSLIITSINRQSRALDELAVAGGGQRYLQRALVAVRALDQIYKGKGSYGTSDAQAFANDLLSYSDKYRAVLKGVLQHRRNGDEVERLFYSQPLEVWTGVNATTEADVFEKMGLWDVLTRVFVSAKAVFQSHASWRQQGLNLSSMPPGEFLLRSGQALNSGMRPVINTLLQSAVSWTNAVNRLQLTFLLVEGLCVAGCCAAGLMYMLKSAFDQRYQLYETFLSIPIGLTRALAAQTTHLLDDESDSQSEDEDDRERYEDGPPSAMVVGRDKRKTLFEERTAVFEADGNEGAAGGGGAGGGGGERGGGGAVSDEEGPKPQRGADLDRAPGAAGRRGPNKGRSTSKRFALPDDTDDGSFGPLGDLSLLTPTADPTNLTLRTLGLGRKRWRDICGGCLRPFLRRWWRTGAVQPMQSSASLGTLGGGGGSGPAQQPRRTLIRNSKVAKGMLSLVVLYSILVILFYSVNYAILIDVTDQVALQAVADQNAERTYRAVFYAQELAAEEDIAAVPGHVSLLQNATKSLRDAYYTMRIGAKAWTVVGHDAERFPSVTSHGLIKGSPGMFNLFYADNTCLRLPEHWPCPLSDYPFYEVTRSGADGMMSQMLSELGSLVDEAMAAVAAAAAPDSTAAAPQLPGLNSSHWDFIYNVGTQDLNDANLRISVQHITDVKGVLKVVVVIHVVLLMLLMGLCLAFLVLGYLPLLRRMDKEKRRIAEMMSQLPAELDVMKLFSNVLLGPTKGGAHAHGRHSHAGSGVGGSHRTVSSSGAIDNGEVGGGRLRPGSPAPAAAANATMTATVGGGAAGPEAVAANPGADAPGASAMAGDGTNSSGSKGYQAWKDILSRGSLSGGNGTAIPTVTPRPKARSLPQF
ncbi:hypothetical protein PLESTF_001521700 [Pleodorina starrii]|nr:hypothetical protein PLESTF_001521700 [Pleodorina starrii]